MPIISYQGKTPKIAADAYISPRATVIGSTTIGARCNVWEHAVIRADYNTIDIGNYYAILPANGKQRYLEHHNGSIEVEIGFSYNSGTNKEWATVEQLRDLIKKHIDPSFKPI